jgi:hypothetical protein
MIVRDPIFEHLSYFCGNSTSISHDHPFASTF